MKNTFIKLNFIRRLSGAFQSDNFKYDFPRSARDLSVWLALFVIFCFSFSAPVTGQTESNKNYFERGSEDIKRQDFASAFNSFREALKISPEDENSRRGLVIALIGVEKFQAASREIALLLARHPKDEKLLELAAQSFMVQKRFAEAEIVLQRRLAAGNEKAELWAQFGDVSDAQKKTAEAVAAYQKAVELDPESNTFRYALGALLWKLIRYDEAEAVFLEILRREPREPRASFNLGDIYLTRGDAKKAIPFLEIAAAAFPNEFDTHFALGRAYFAVENFDKSIEELSQAVKINDQIAEGFYHLGRALQKSGRTDEAATALKKARALQNAKRESENIENRKPED